MVLADEVNAPEAGVRVRRREGHEGIGEVVAADDVREAARQERLRAEGSVLCGAVGRKTSSQYAGRNKGVFLWEGFGRTSSEGAGDLRGRIAARFGSPETAPSREKV